MTRSYFPGFLILFFLAACSTSPRASAPPFDTYDVSFVGVPFKALALGEGTSADAVEITPDGTPAYTAVVLLAVERELKGSLPRVKPAVPSKMSQAGEALKNKEFLKVLLMDFENPEAEDSKAWISAAVADPAETFGIRKGMEPERGRRYRVYLRNTGSGYHMIAAYPER